MNIATEFQLPMYGGRSGLRIGDNLLKHLEIRWNSLGEPHSPEQNCSTPERLHQRFRTAFIMEATGNPQIIIVPYVEEPGRSLGENQVFFGQMTP